MDREGDRAGQDGDDRRGDDPVFHRPLLSLSDRGAIEPTIGVCNTEIEGVAIPTARLTQPDYTSERPDTVIIFGR